MKRQVAIFGEMPSESGWKLLLQRCKTPARAEKVAERLACTGVVGKLLADLAGIDLPVRRFNLNARWREQYDETEAAISASTVLTHYPEIKRIVCLGRNVGNTMGFLDDAPFLSIRRCNGKAYLLLPHPSKRNRWWNDLANERRAGIALRNFLRCQRT